MKTKIVKAEGNTKSLLFYFRGASYLRVAEQSSESREKTSKLVFRGASYLRLQSKVVKAEPIRKACLQRLLKVLPIFAFCGEYSES